MMESKDIFSKFKQFDAYPKTLEDFRVKTVTGAGGMSEIFYLGPSLSTSKAAYVVPKCMQD